MKSLKTGMFTLSMMVAGSITMFAQSADEIVAQHIKAIGGMDNWKKVAAIKKTGSLTAQGMEIPIEITVVQDKAARQEFTVMGMTNYTIITPTEGWYFMPIQQQTKPEALTPEVLKKAQDELDIQGALVDYKNKGNKVELAGKEDINGKACFKLKITSKAGEEKSMYIDVTNYYLLREVKKVTVEGKDLDVTVDYSNYSKLPEGVVVAMSIESQEGPVTFKSIEVNPKIDESAFKPQ